MRYLLVLLSLIITFSCTPNTSSTGNSTKMSPKAGFSSYTHPFGIYGINVPDLWTREFNDKTETITLTNPPIDGRDFDEKVSIVTRRGALFYDNDKKKMISKQVDLAPLVKEYIKAINKNKGFKLIEQPADNSSNEKAKIVFEFEGNDGLALKTQTELVNNGDIALFVHYTASKKTFDKTFPTYQDILKSIQFLEK